MDDLTRILSAVERGDSAAAEELLPLVYDELRKLAARRRPRPGLERRCSEAFRPDRHASRDGSAPSLTCVA